jgi:hypothetical protein
MAEKIKLVQGDTKPALVCNITDEITGNPIGLTGATVLLKFRAVGATDLTATVTGSITDGPNGQVAFYPASAPAMLLGEAGDYEGEIQITFSDTTVQTVYDLLKFKLREDF